LAGARLIVKEDAIAVGELPQTLANPNFSDVVLFKSFDVLTQQLSQLFNLFRIDPHETGSTRAAIATLGTLETEAILVPRLGGARFGSAHRRLAPVH
jgi:hypothetical protein